MSGLKFDPLDVIRNPDDYTSREREQAAEAVGALLSAAQAFPADPHEVHDWHPRWRDRMVALIEAAADFKNKGTFEAEERLDAALARVQGGAA